MTQIDPRLVRLVAKRFNDLKGFHKVPFALAIGAAGEAWSLSGSELVVFLGGLAGFVIGMITYLFVVGDTYDNLGRVATSARSRVNSGWVGGAAVMVMRFQADLHIPGPSIVWLGFGLYFLWIAIDGWPWRWSHALTGASAVYVAYGWVAVPHAAPFAWMAPRLWLFAATLTATSIADHLLLTRTLRVHPTAAEENA